MEIAPGKVVRVWTFGDRVPGPVIRVRVGDTVEVTIRNKGTIQHSIDFHAARIAPDKAFRNVDPGERLTYSFEATAPGCSCTTAAPPRWSTTSPNGMYGMIIVEPEGGLPPVKQEFAFVQSEFYVSDTPASRPTTPSSWPTSPTWSPSTATRPSTRTTPSGFAGASRSGVRAGRRAQHLVRLPRGGHHLRPRLDRRHPPREPEHRQPDLNLSASQARWPSSGSTRRGSTPS